MSWVTPDTEVQVTITWKVESLDQRSGRCTMRAAGSDWVEHPYRFMFAGDVDPAQVAIWQLWRAHNALTTRDVFVANPIDAVRDAEEKARTLRQKVRELRHRVDDLERQLGKEKHRSVTTMGQLRALHMKLGIPDAELLPKGHFRNELSENEQIVLESLEQKMTYTAIGRRLNLSVTRVGQIHKRAVRKEEDARFQESLKTMDRESLRAVRVADLPVSIRIQNVLCDETIGDVVDAPLIDLYKRKHFGRKSARELVSYLRGIGFTEYAKGEFR